MKFRKKPVVIDAILNTGGNGVDIMNWFLSFPTVPDCRVEIETRGERSPHDYVLVHTLEGIMEGRPGDWIIRGVKGEFYPCKPDIFEATYEPAELGTKP